MRRFAFALTLVAAFLAVFLFSNTSANAALNLSIGRDDGSNYHVGSDTFGSGEQLSLGAEINVEKRYVNGASLVVSSLPSDPYHFRGSLDIYGVLDGFMGPAAFKSQSMTLDGVHLFIANQVEEMRPPMGIPTMFYEQWANVAIEGLSSFTSADFNEYKYNQDDGTIYFNDVFTFNGERQSEKGIVLQGFSVNETMDVVPEPSTLGFITGSTITFLRRIRRR